MLSLVRHRASIFRSNAELSHEHRKDKIDFQGCGFSPRLAARAAARGTNHRLQASRPSGGGAIRRKAFHAGVYPPPAQPTGFSR